MDDTLDLATDLTDIGELLDHAARLAYRISGYNPGRAADPEWGIPEEKPDPGWPAMVKLCDDLTALRKRFDEITSGEVAEAIEAAKKEQDRYDL